MTVDYDTKGISAVDKPHVELRIIGKNGADSHQDSVVLTAEFVSELEGLGRTDPLRITA